MTRGGRASHTGGLPLCYRTLPEPGSACRMHHTPWADGGASDWATSVTSWPQHSTPLDCLVCTAAAPPLHLALLGDHSSASNKSCLIHPFISFRYCFIVAQEHMFARGFHPKKIKNFCHQIC